MQNDCITCVGNHILSLLNQCLCPEKMYDLNRLDNCLRTQNLKNIIYYYYLFKALVSNCDPTCSKCVGPLKNECVECVENRTISYDGQCPCSESYYLTDNKCQCKRLLN